MLKWIKNILGIFTIIVIIIVGPFVIRYALSGKTVAGEFISVATHQMVHDNANMLSDEQENRLAVYHNSLLQHFDIDLRVMTMQADDINAVAAKQFAALKVGEYSSTGRGLLLLIDPVQNKVRFEVGRNLEGIYTDAFVSYIERNQMVPFFRAGRVAIGVEATTEFIVSRAYEADMNVAFESPVADFEPSTGAGATTDARIGEGFELKRKDDKGFTILKASATSPIETLQAYRIKLSEYNNSADSDIYAKSWRESMLNRMMPTTKAQAKMELKMSSCPMKDLLINGKHAVYRQSLAEEKYRICPPYFFVKEEGKWRLDLNVMAHSIRFNMQNFWMIDPEELKNSAYFFAFTPQNGWIFLPGKNDTTIGLFPHEASTLQQKR